MKRTTKECIEKRPGQKNYTLCLKKYGVELLHKLHPLLTDFENSFTVGNTNELSTK